MIMNQGAPGAVISDYSSYIKNCTLNQWPYKVPVNSLADVQLYVNLPSGGYVAQYELIRTCGEACYNFDITNLSGLERFYQYYDCNGDLQNDSIGAFGNETVCGRSVVFNSEIIVSQGAACTTPDTIVPINYVIAQDTNGNFYALFKGFSGASNLTCFVIAITINDTIYFSEEYCIPLSCHALTLIKGCYGNLDNKLAYDCEGIYFGKGQGSVLGDGNLVYQHELLIKNVEVSLSVIKNSFKQGRTRNFRTEKERLFQFYADFVPEWYLKDIDAVFYRGEVYIDGVKYLVSDTTFEKIEDCKRAWKPSVILKENCLLSFSCESDPCQVEESGECCDPEFIDATVEEIPQESGGPGDNPGDSGEDSSTSGFNYEFGLPDDFPTVIIECVVGGIPVVTGTVEPVYGIDPESLVVTCDVFIGARVRVTRGNIPVPGIDPLDGSYYVDHDPLTNFITLNVALVEGEYIRIQTVL